MLSVEKVRANGAGEEVGESLSQEQTAPTEEVEEARADEDMTNERDDAVGVFPGIVEEWVEAHAVQEHENVAKKDGERVSDEKVAKAGAARGI